MQSCGTAPALDPWDEFFEPEPEVQPVLPVSTSLRGALTGARLGIRVAPVTEGEKFPPIHDFPTLATTDESQIMAWAKERRWLNSNWLALATPDTVCFIDEDQSARLRALYQERYNEAFPSTRTTQSQNDHCQSIWKQTERTRALGNRAQGAFLDGMLSFRQDGNYCIAEGSHLNASPINGSEPRDYILVDDSPIAEMPDKLVDLIESLLVEKETKKSRVKLIVNGKPVEPPPPHPGFRTLFDRLGWAPLEARLNLHADSRFHNFSLGEGEANTYCPIPSHGPQDPDVAYRPCFGVIAGEPHLLHCFGCGWTGDLVSACYQVGGDTTKTMYDVARRICEEQSLKFEDFFPQAKPTQIQAELKPLLPWGENSRAKKEYVLDFKFPPRESHAFDFVIGPAMGAAEGWFPLGDPSLIGGPSGGNKSTLMIDLLEAQRNRQDFLGHATFGLSYVILMADRGENAHIRTAARMRFDPKSTPIKFLSLVQGEGAAQAILAKIEECDPMPSAVFIEGCDMLVENASKLEVVGPFMKALQSIARHYHIAIIGSVGSAKQKVGEGYTSKRDHIFGSVGWGRTCETVAVLQYVEGDDMDKRRTLSVLPRNAAPEKYNLKLENGRLVVDNSESEPSRVSEERREISWFRTSKDWFTLRDIERGLGVSYTTAYRYAQDANAKRIILSKKKVAGEARQYRWNDSDANPEWRGHALPDTSLD
jgi:hypothetical protein